MIKRLLKISLYVLAGFIGLLILIGGLTQTRRFKNWLRDEIVELATSSLNGTFHLGRIEGNLVSRFVLEDLRIDLEGDTVLYVPSITLGLRPLGLLQRHVEVSFLSFQKPRLFLRQRSDSTWNIAHLLKPAAQKSEPARPSPWRIALQHLQIKNGALQLMPSDTSRVFFPQHLQNISTAMRIDYTADQLHIVLRNIRLETPQPEFKLDSLAAKIFWAHDSLAIQDLRLRFGQSCVAGKLTLRHPAQPVFTADLRGAPLHLDDLRQFYPNVPASGSVQCTINAIGDRQHVRTTFHLEHESGRAEGNFFILKDSVTAHYNLEAAVRALNLYDFLPSPGVNSRLNFDIKLDGSGLTPEALDTKLRLALDSSQVMGREIAQFRLSAQAHNQQVQAKLTLRSSIGDLDLVGQLIDPRRQQYFELNADLRRFNLAALLQNDTLASDLSLHIAGKGKNFDRSLLRFDGSASISPSRLPFVLVDSAYCRFHLRGTDIQLDTLRVASSTGKVYASGLFSLSYDNDLRFRSELGDLALVKAAVAADTLRAAGTISGTARGPLDSLSVAGLFELNNVQYNTTSANRLLGNFTFHRREAQAGGLLQLKGYEIAMGYLPADSAVAAALYDLNRAQLTATFWQGEKNNGKLEGLYTFGEIGRFDIWKGELNLLGQTWRTPVNGEMWMLIGDEEYEFHNFILTSGRQKVYGDGRLSYASAEDLRYRIEGIELSTLSPLLAPDTSSTQTTLAGILAIEGHLTGTAEAPILDGQFSLDKGRIADFMFEKWTGDFSYVDEQLSWQFNLWQNTDRRLTGTGYLPMNLAFENTGGEVLYYDRPIRLQAATAAAGIDLAFLQTLTGRAKNVQGTLVFDVKLENTLNEPRTKGALRVLDGAFFLPQAGVAYNDLQLVASLDTSFVEVNYFEVHSDKGAIEAKGRLNFTKEAIGDAEGHLRADNFLLSRKREMEVRIDAEIQGAGDASGASYQGDISVVRSRFFLPALQKRGVIQLEEEAQAKPVPADCTKTAAAAPANPMQQWLQKIQGELNINIPRNTWIRGPELTVEIEGALDFVQLGEKLSLFGTVNLVRGTYELYGKRFDIEKGQLIFEGDLETLPRIELVAHHVFRQISPHGERREKQIIEIKVSGALTNPEINFTLGNERLDEQDALAYLLFGVSFDQLRSGERAGLSQGLNTTEAFSSAAQSLLTGMISQQLAKSLSRSLDLDMIEFQSGGDISQSALLVGKYITNELFLSFSQDFSSPNGQVVSLEYEIAKFLFLQAAHGGEENKKTGFDLIWKWDW